MKLTAWLSVAAALSLSCLPSFAQSSSAATINGFRPAWWKEGVVYQVYPRSFKDSNGDGIGDLNGITSKLDYLQHLGVNVIWLSPHYDSPNADNGYDIRDYRKVMTEFGTMADFDRMLAGLKQRHMRLIIDLVVNHTSDEHKWFVESAKSKTNPYRDFYIWRDGKPNPSAPHGFDPPNNYPSFFSGSAWEWSEPTKQFYLHLFASQTARPQLGQSQGPRRGLLAHALLARQGRRRLPHGRHPPHLQAARSARPHPPAAQVRQLRRPLGQRPQTRPVPPRDERPGPRQVQRHERRRSHRHLARRNPHHRRRRPPRALRDLQLRRHRYRPRQHRHLLRPPWKLPELKAIYDHHAEVLGTDSWDTVFLSNHDNSRVVSTFGNDSPAFRVPSAKLIETMLLTLRGTPYLYEGDELGMTNYPWKKVSEFNDIEVQNAYKAEVLTGHMTAEALVAGASTGRPR